MTAEKNYEDWRQSSPNRSKFVAAENYEYTVIIRVTRFLLESNGI
jgi:hypothetical protein